MTGQKTLCAESVGLGITNMEMRDMKFEIGDLVEIGSETHYAEVTGVIRDDERLFVWFPNGDEEREFPFGAVVKQWRVVPNVEVSRNQQRPQNDE